MRVFLINNEGFMMKSKTGTGDKELTPRQEAHLRAVCEGRRAASAKRRAAKPMPIYRNGTLLDLIMELDAKQPTSKTTKSKKTGESSKTTKVKKKIRQI